MKLNLKNRVSVKNDTVIDCFLLEHQKKMETLHQQEREKKLKFQKEVEKIIAHFVNSDDKRFKMKPMNKLSRTVV